MKTMYKFIQENRYDVIHKGMTFISFLMNYALEPLGDDIEK